MRLRTFPALLCALLPLVAQAAPQTAVLDVQRMTCALCPVTVKKALEQVAGVRQATIDFDKKTATVTYDPERATPAALVKATTNAGYPSVVRK